MEAVEGVRTCIRSSRTTLEAQRVASATFTTASSIVGR